MRRCHPVLSALAALTLAASPAGAASTGVVISQVYGGGGNSGSTYTNDFIELFNLGPGAVNLAGWSVQYASAAGNTWLVTNLSGSIQPGQYYLVQQAQGAGGTTPLPAPDAAGTIAMNATTGKVALVSSTTAFAVPCPTGPSVVDFVGYGTTATCFENAPAPPPRTSTRSNARTNARTSTTTPPSSRPPRPTRATPRRASTRARRPASARGAGGASSRSTADSPMPDSAFGAAAPSSAHPASRRGAPAVTQLLLEP